MAVRKISPSELKAWLARDPGQANLSVRESWELALASLGKVLHIPVGELPGRIAEIDRHRHSVVICECGRRSLSVAEYLNQQGFGQVFNLTRGITAWLEQVDPDIPIY